MTDKNTRAENFYNALISLCKSSKLDLEIQRTIDTDEDLQTITVLDRDTEQDFTLLEIRDRKVHIAYDTIAICEDIPETGENTPLTIELAYTFHVSPETVSEAISSALNSEGTPSRQQPANQTAPQAPAAPLASLGYDD